MLYRFLYFAKKINKSIADIKNFFFDRKILICREITKFYEEYIRTDVSNLKLFEKSPKGEITLVLSPKKEAINISNNLSESDKKIINQMIKTVSVKDITNIFKENKNISKKEIYNFCLNLKKK